MNDQPSLPFITARPRVRVTARPRYRVTVGHFSSEFASIQSFPKKPALVSDPSKDAAAILAPTSSQRAPSERAWRTVEGHPILRNGYHEGQMKNLPQPWFPYVTNAERTFQQFRLDPRCNRSEMGHDYDERELAGLWEIIEFWRARRAGE